MSYRISYASSYGSREVNQDSYYACAASTCFGDVCCAAVADGIGGLSCGEYASSEVVRSLDQWFMKSFPGLLENGARRSEIRESLLAHVRRTNEDLNRFGRRESKRLGTTAALFLGIDGRGMILNVGDSRVYSVRGKRCTQLTTDQTEAMREVRKGSMSLFAAERSPLGGILLQCIGSGIEPVPDVFPKYLHRGEVLLLCTDGFRHRVSPGEMSESLRDQRTEAEVGNALEHLIDLAILRGERDNITAVAVWRR